MPRYSKTIICLANSRKRSGRCIAGKELLADGIGNWVRPISKRPDHELSEFDRRYDDGQDPRLLDVVRIGMLEPRPNGFQSENHLIDENVYWEKIRVATKAELRSVLDTVNGPLWGLASSSYNGLNNRVAAAAAQAIGTSLKLVEVKDLRIEVGVEGLEHPKRKLRGRFTLNGTHYLLSVTDPVQERKYLALPDGAHQIGKAILCISLGEPYYGYAYKLIAAIMT